MNMLQAAESPWSVIKGPTKLHSETSSGVKLNPNLNTISLKIVSQKAKVKVTKICAPTICILSSSEQNFTQAQKLP